MSEPRTIADLARAVAAEGIERERERAEVETLYDQALALHDRAEKAERELEAEKLAHAAEVAGTKAAGDEACAVLNTIVANEPIAPWLSKRAKAAIRKFVAVSESPSPHAKALTDVVEAAREHQCVPTGEIQNEGGDRSCGICDALAALDGAA